MTKNIKAYLMGMNAFERDVPTCFNPYKQSDKKYAWLDGWYAARDITYLKNMPDEESGALTTTAGSS